MQKNLTLTVEDDVLESMRKVAIELVTSVNQMVRDYFDQTIRKQESRRASAAGIQGSFSKHSVKLGKITWKRDDLHKRR